MTRFLYLLLAILSQCQG